MGGSTRTLTRTPTRTQTLTPTRTGLASGRRKVSACNATDVSFEREDQARSAFLSHLQRTANTSGIRVLRGGLRGRRAVQRGLRRRLGNQGRFRE